jgi:RimJ/RimL family protein N-acetyltransferase
VHVLETVRFTLRPFHPDDVGELACLIRPDHWGEGVAAEVCARVLDHAFETTHLERAYARCDANDAKSVRALEKLGLNREATLRKQRVDREGQLVDECWYGILKEEWQRR